MARSPERGRRASGYGAEVVRMIARRESSGLLTPAPPDSPTPVRNTVSLLLVLTLFALVASAQEVPAEFRSFLADYNGGRLSTARWDRWFSLYGPVEIRFVDESALGKTIWTQGIETHAWLGFIPGDSPAQYGVITLGGRAPRAVAAEVPATRKDIAKAIADYIRMQSHAGRFSGVVLVTLAGETLYRGVSGQHITPTTMFSVASVGKIFTAAAIGALVDDGKVGLDEPVSRYVPEVEAGRAPTIRQLLDHTSGVGVVSRWMRDQHDRSLAELADAIARSEPQFAPGAGIRYSNEAYVLLGRVVERACGCAYADFLEKRIFARAGMHHTGFWRFADARTIARPLTRYRTDGDDETYVPGPRVPAVPMLRIRGTPAGGAITTADDLDRFLSAFWGAKLMSRKLVADFVAEHASEPAPPGVPARPGFGYGFEVSAQQGTISKTGGAPGVSAYVSVLPKIDARVIVLSNYDSIAPIVAAHIEDLVRTIRR
jgi:CubicO group peptidase (beta-lactamase class C family)